MPEAVSRYCWDSCVFLSYIQGISSRVPDIDALLQSADEKKIEIVASAITIVEVAFAQGERVQKKLDRGVEAKIDSLWEPPSPIKLVEFHRLIAQRARNLIREAVSRGWGLKPLDAIHLSTAEQLDATAFHTYDESLDKYHELIGLSVGRPLASQIPIVFPAASQE